MKKWHYGNIAGSLLTGKKAQDYKEVVSVFPMSPERSKLPTFAYHLILEGIAGGKKIRTQCGKKPYV